MVLIKSLESLHVLRAVRGPTAKDTTYQNAPSVEQLMVSTARAYYGDYYKYQLDKQLYLRMQRVAAVMREGAGATADYTQWFQDASEARLYSRAQHNGSKGVGRMLAAHFDVVRARRVLDVGGGSGPVSAELCARAPHLDCTVLDFPTVVATGEELRAELAQTRPDVARRLHFIPGSALDCPWAVPHGRFDVVLMSYLCVSVPFGALPALFREAFRVLGPGGQLVLHDFISAGPDAAGGAGTYTALWTFMHVSVNAEVQMLYAEDLQAMLEAAGFVGVRRCPGLPAMTSVLVAQRPSAKL